MLFYFRIFNFNFAFAFTFILQNILLLPSAFTFLPKAIQHIVLLFLIFKFCFSFTFTFTFAFFSKVKTTLFSRCYKAEEKRLEILFFLIESSIKQ